MISAAKKFFPVTRAGRKGGGFPVKHAVFVYQAPQTFSFAYGVTPFELAFLKTLKAEISRGGLNWDICIDNTDGDFEQLKRECWDLVIMRPYNGPWLRCKALRLDNVIVLTTMECFACVAKNRLYGVRRVLDYMAKHQ